MAAISDRIGAGSDVLVELGNRVDITAGAPSRLARWYGNAYISVGMGYPLEQLENSTTATISNTNQLAFPDTARAIRSLICYDSAGSPFEPEFKDVKTVRRMSLTSTPGKPSVYTVFQQQIIFAPAFDSQVYTYILDTWDKPQLTVDIVSTVLLVPDDWLEAVDYAAMMRGHAILGERDKARELRSFLFGSVDPTTGAFIPGLLSQLQTRSQANAPARDYGIQPRGTKQGYTK